MEDEEAKYLNFLPKANEERYGKSVDFLQSSLKNSEIHNIGILGTYGSGKSSLIKTFEARLDKGENSDDKEDKETRKISKKKYRKVSLASFSDQPIASKKEVEAEIAQQLFYSAGPHKTPRSKIERIKGFSPSILFICLSFLVGTIFAGLGYFFFKSYQFNTNHDVGLVFFVAAILFLCLAIFLFASSFPLKHVSLSVSQATVEADKENARENNNNSFFDDVAPEIIYFFERTQTNVVVFEDIDRIQKDSGKYIPLLSDLRNLNVLINNNPKIKKKKGVVFIYCVKDDCFTNENERVKFFDSIISIAPIVSPYNSAETIISLFDKNISQSEIVTLSFFISERRMINSIKTDFERYLELNGEEIIRPKDYGALFALMVYKNVAPKDFDLFATNSEDSVLYSLLFKGTDRFDKPEYNLAKVIVSNQYIEKDCHKYISLFQKGLFENRIDKDVFESIKNGTSYDNAFAKIEHPESVLNKTDPNDVNHQAILKVLLVHYLINCANPNQDLKSKKESLLKSFENPDEKRKEFVDELFSPDNPYQKETLAILASPIGRQSWVFKEISNKDVCGSNMPLFKSYLSAQFGKDEESCSTAFASISSTYLSDYFSALENPCEILEDFSNNSLAYLFQKQGIIFTALKTAKEGNVGNMMIEFGAYRKTYDNVCVICDGLFGKPVQETSLFTSIFSTSRGHFIAACLENANSLIDAHVSRGRTFADESEKAANYLFNEANLASTESRNFCDQYAQKHSFCISLEKDINYSFTPLLIEKHLLVPNLDHFSTMSNGRSAYRQGLFLYYLNNHDKATKNEAMTEDAKNFIVQALAQQTEPLPEDQINILRLIPFGLVKDFDDSDEAFISLFESDHLGYSSEAFQEVVNFDNANLFTRFAKRFNKEILLETNFPALETSFALILFQQQQNDQDKINILFKTSDVLCVEENRAELKSIRGAIANPNQTIADYFYGYLKKGLERKAYLAKNGEAMSLKPLEDWALNHEPKFKEWLQQGTALRRTTTSESASIIRAIAKKRGRHERRERLTSIFE